MLSIFIALLVNLFIETSVSFNVVVPRDQKVAHVGSTVTLPCWITPPENAEALEIRWYRHDQFSNPILFYQNRKIQDIQEESYRNRTSLTLRSDQSGGLKDGDVSLRLEKLMVQDEGSFHCYVSGEKAYDSGEIVLKVTALGSAPVLFPQPLDDGRVNISCRSSGWYPEPTIRWMSDERTVLRPGGVSASRSRGADQMFSVHSWTVVSHSNTQLVSCSMSLKTGEFREGRLNIQAITSSDPWKALFFTVLICALGLVGLILYKYRHKLTGKKTAKKICDDESAERLTKEAVRDTNTEELKKDAVCEDGPMEKLTKEVVGDVNIEELRKHAVQITIDPQRLHPDLRVSEDCKTVRDSRGYKHAGEGFPYHLYAFGAQVFKSGRHYWEVSLAQEDKPPKNYWLIGVMKHVRIRLNKSLTPSNGYWFLCSDGPKGFYINSDQSISLSLTPRPEQLGVLLDYDGGQLSFYNVKERKHLLTMSTRFTGSVIVPLFNPGVGDQSPLKILDCPKPEESPVESSQPLLSNSSKPEESHAKSSQNNSSDA